MIKRIAGNKTKVKCPYSHKCKDSESHLCGSCLNNKLRSYYTPAQTPYYYWPYYYWWYPHYPERYAPYYPDWGPYIDWDFTTGEGITVTGTDCLVSHVDSSAPDSGPASYYTSG